MLHSNVSCGENPAAVSVEALPDGRYRVVLSRDFLEIEGPEDDGVTWQGQQVDFILPEGRDGSEVPDDFDLWWSYGEEWTPTDAAPTLEQRVADMEDALLALMGL